MTIQVRIINNEPSGGDSIRVIELKPGLDLYDLRIVLGEITVPPGGNKIIWLRHDTQVVICPEPQAA